MTLCYLSCRRLPCLVLFLVLFSCLAAAQVPGAGQKRVSHRNDKQLRQIPIDEKTTLLYDEDGTFFYLGSISQLKNGKPFPHGSGLCRTVARNPITGEVSYEYCSCNWKRGSRHGEGIMRLPDGTCRKAVWQWDHLQTVSDTPPSRGEIETLEKHIWRLEKLISLL